LKPFIGLIDKLGAFAGQIADDGLEAVEIEYEGEVSHLNTQPLTESRRENSPIYGSLIRIKVLTGGRWRTIDSHPHSPPRNGNEHARRST
jgi:D-3-phosphoglycerate dehydrogenase